jgi:hypothetical protein
MYLYYANLIGDYQRVVEHWILDEEWLKAIEVISRQVRISCDFARLVLTLILSDRS